MIWPGTLSHRLQSNFPGRCHHELGLLLPEHQQPSGPVNEPKTTNVSVACHVAFIVMSSKVSEQRERRTHNAPVGSIGSRGFRHLSGLHGLSQHIAAVVSNNLPMLIGGQRKVVACDRRKSTASEPFHQGKGAVACRFCVTGFNSFQKLFPGR